MRDEGSMLSDLDGGGERWGRLYIWFFEHEEEGICIPFGDIAGVGLLAYVREQGATLLNPIFMVLR